MITNSGHAWISLDLPQVTRLIRRPLVNKSHEFSFYAGLKTNRVTKQFGSSKGSSLCRIVCFIAMDKTHSLR